jgi:hypothetical protein
MAYSAFLADPRCKERVLSGATTPAAPGDIWWPVNFDQAAITTYCELNGLDPAFFHFVRALVGPNGEDEISQNLVDTLTALPLGVDTQAIFNGWLLWLWDGRDGESLKSVLSGSDAFAPACELIKLHQRSETSPVSRQQWRQARSAVLKASQLSPEQTSAANIVAAMGWDFATTPGAAADLVHTFFSESSERVSEAFGWTEADGADVQAAIVRLHTVAGAELGPPPADRSDREAMTIYLDAFKAITEREKTEAEAQAMARMQELGAVGSERAHQLQAQLREGLLLKVRTAPLVAGEPVHT